MNIQQFQYVLAVVDSENFGLAAEKCFVTQSTLSTMINRFETEIGVKVFNRKTKPVSITKEGDIIIERLRVVVNEIDVLKNTLQEIKGEMVGDLKIGIIPTIAPYLLPLFVNEFSEMFPKVKILVKEMTTSKIQKSILQRDLDIGILALPLHQKELLEYKLYNEPFLVYDCTDDKRQAALSASELNYPKMCLLEEGHCLRTQVYDICELSAKSKVQNKNFKFESGSMDTLIKITESRQGMTILPYLASYHLSDQSKKNLINFKVPVPVRTIGLVTHQFFVKNKLQKSLVEIIEKAVKPLIPEVDKERVVNPV